MYNDFTCRFYVLNVRVVAGLDTHILISAILTRNINNMSQLSKLKPMQLLLISHH